MYAIVKTGGKQYRVEEGQSLLVERLPGDDGAKIPLLPLLYVDGDTVVDGEGLANAKVSVEARVLSQERGPKLRIVKFKPKRGYKRRTGHRQELTRIEVTGIKLGARKASSRQAPKPVAAEASSTAEAPSSAGAAEKPARARAKPAASAAKPTAGAAKPSAGAAKPARSRAKPAADKPATGDAKPAAAKKPARKRSKPATTESTPEEGNGA
jgi:large subunit ribosomal protein L21